MPSFDELYTRRCVADLILVIEQIPVRAAARSPMSLDESSVAMVALWTLLRWERTFLLILLEDLGVDMWALTCDLDALLKERRRHDAAAGHPFRRYDWRRPAFRRELDRLLLPLLDRTEQEAARLQDPYLGTEHLLLAIIADADDALGSLLARHEITYEKVQHAVLAALAALPRETAAAADRPGPARRTGRPWGAAWDTEAVGVPRRFGAAILLLIVTMYAILFAALQLLGASVTVFAVVAILATGVGMGQMLLFDGKYPRAASIWIGTCLLPVEILGVFVVRAFRDPAEALSPDFIAAVFTSVLLSVPVGALFGYLSGGLTAGVFLILNWYAERVERRSSSGQRASEGPQEDEV